MYLRSEHAAPVPRRGVTHGEAFPLPAIPALSVVDHGDGERHAITAIALGRKNWIFVGSDDGAEWNATIVSLIASCALHHIDPWAYLRDVLILLPSWPRDRVLELAPKSWKQTLENTDARQRLAASPWTAPATLAA
ncbi:transposase domain-containing protein [Sorangium sp. So ce1000]|uniref:transposase domain-containing protein n=1 Tax=Sorangium sp. So ce1000 TaxID=3133325 RepID=UPI003F5D5DDA